MRISDWSSDVCSSDLEKGTPYAELGLDDEGLSDEALIDAMMAHPILINRPLVVSPVGVKLCRPSEAVLDILPTPQQGAFAKEDGEQAADASDRKSTRLNYRH